MKRELKIGSRITVINLGTTFRAVVKESKVDVKGRLYYHTLMVQEGKGSGRRDSMWSRLRSSYINVWLHQEDDSWARGWNTKAARVIATAITLRNLR